MDNKRKRPIVEFPTTRPPPVGCRFIKKPGFEDNVVDPFAKRAVLEVSPSVVSVVCYSGLLTGCKKLSRGSGIIFERCYSTNTICYYVLTSTTILRPHDNANKQRPPATTPPPLSSVPGDQVNDSSDSVSRDKRICADHDDESSDNANKQRPPSTTPFPLSSVPGDQVNDSLDSVSRDKTICADHDDESSDESSFLIEVTSSDDDSSSVDSFIMDDNPIQDDKIFVWLSTGEKCTGEIFAHDDHYNIAILKIEPPHELQMAYLRPVDDSVAIRICRSVNGRDSVKLVPGDAVIAVGRHYENLHEIMAVLGKYSVGKFDLKNNCKGFLQADCKIDEFGIGGSLINYAGEVIGINLYAQKVTHFLPTNICLKWWDYYKVNQNYRRPFVGVKAAKSFAPSLRICESLIERNIFHAVVIEKVLQGSPAAAAGIRPSDIIVKCAGRGVTSFLEFLEIIWDVTGNVVDIEVMRKSSFTDMKIVVEDITLRNVCKTAGRKNRGKKIRKTSSIE